MSEVSQGRAQTRATTREDIQRSQESWCGCIVGLDIRKSHRTARQGTDRKCGPQKGE